jgi:hypothetical protein
MNEREGRRRKEILIKGEETGKKITGFVPTMEYGETPEYKSNAHGLQKEFPKMLSR